MKEVLGALRRADARYHLIDDGDVIGVGVSGGKDSLATLLALARYRQFSKKAYELHAITVGMGYDGDFFGVAAFCETLGVPFTLRPTRIGPVIFEERREKNPCSLCATMRRGVLHRVAKELGCNKVALGHHLDDAVETLMLSLLEEGRLHTFQPVSYLSRKDITVIRPLLYATERAVQRVVISEALPVVQSMCPANGKTRRADVKRLIDSLSAFTPDARAKLRHALVNTAQYGLWDGEFPRTEAPTLPSSICQEEKVCSNTL